MTPSDLVALVKRLREWADADITTDFAHGQIPDELLDAAAAIEQLQAELDIAHMALKLKPRPYADADLLIEERDAARAELAAVKADVSELRALDNEAQHGADELTADAKRYRWLKAHHLQTGPDSWIRTGDDLEEAVDAARAQAGGK